MSAYSGKRCLADVGKRTHEVSSVYYVELSGCGLDTDQSHKTNHCLLTAGRIRGLFYFNGPLDQH